MQTHYIVHKLGNNPYVPVTLCGNYRNLVSCFHGYLMLFAQVDRRKDTTLYVYSYTLKTSTNLMLEYGDLKLWKAIHVL